MNLTFSESECSITLTKQSTEQLEYTLKVFTEESAYDSVEYMFITRNNYTVPVKKEFLIMAVLNEINFRRVTGEN